MKYSSETIDQAYENLKLMTISDLHRFELGKFMHKINNGTAPETFDLSSLVIDHDYNTRARISGNLNLTRPRTEIGKTRLEYKGAKLWNSLPIFLKQITRHKTFVYELKKILLQNHLEETSQI